MCFLCAWYTGLTVICSSVSLDRHNIRLMVRKIYMLTLLLHRPSIMTRDRIQGLSRPDTIFWFFKMQVLPKKHAISPNQHWRKGKWWTKEFTFQYQYCCAPWTYNNYKILFNHFKVPFDRLRNSRINWEIY